MRLWLLPLFVLLSGPVFANTQTPNYDLNKPGVNDPVDEDIWGDLLNENWDIIDTELDGLRDDVTTLENEADIPVGTVTFFAGSSAPSLWLLGYGQAVNRVTYSLLFTAIGTTHGVGDGTTTFNVPDCRGRVLAGQDDMGGVSANRLTDATAQGLDGDVLGEVGGEEAHVQTEAELAAHTHTQRSISGGGATPGVFANGGTTFANAGATASTGSSTAFNVVQPTLILNCIIYAGQ